MEETSTLEQRLALFFDKDFYAETYEDVASQGFDALSHYVKFGWREQRRPNAWYSDKLVPMNLVSTNPTTPPFILFLTHLPGITPAEFEKMCGAGGIIDFGHDGCWECQVMRGAFNGTYYRRKYPDIADHSDALIHFCESGWKEMRDPCVGFSTKYYLDSNKDVASAAMNPFVHYLSKGCEEGRKPRPEDLVRRKTLIELKTISEMAKAYDKIVPRVELSSVGALFADLWGKAGGGKGIVVSASHDDYMMHTGGVQKFLRDESEAAQAAGLVYVHLHPTLPNLVLKNDSSLSTFLVNCSVNDKFVGTFTARELVETLEALQSKKADILSVGMIHSMMGWNIAAAVEIFAKRFKNTFFYAHDYYSLCSEYRLLRNNLEPCDAPPVDSVSCRSCAHGDTRERHVAQFVYLFDAVKPTFLHPSKCTRSVFESGMQTRYKHQVVAHLLTSSKKAARPVSAAKSRPKIRIAFCGAPVGHKGIHHFEQIVEHCRDSTSLQFYHFGTERTGIPGVEFVKTVLKDGKSSMAQNLRDQNIDIVFVGSTWRETFNFVAYEAAESGAAIVTLAASGNVADFVRENKLGAVVESWVDCVAILKNESLRSHLESWQAAAARLALTPNKSFLTEGVL